MVMITGSKSMASPFQCAKTPYPRRRALERHARGAEGISLISVPLEIEFQPELAVISPDKRFLTVADLVCAMSAVIHGAVNQLCQSDHLVRLRHSNPSVVKVELVSIKQMVASADAKLMIGRF